VVGAFWGAIIVFGSSKLSKNLSEGDPLEIGDRYDIKTPLSSPVRRRPAWTDAVDIELLYLARDFCYRVKRTQGAIKFELLEPGSSAHD